MILIVGGNGQLGQEFKILFDKMNLEYLSTTRKELNISSKEKIKGFFLDKRFSIIINCAAYNDVDKAENEKEECFSINSEAPLLFSQEAKRQGAIFVTYSTDFVFDGEKSGTYKESDKPNPLSVYGKSKLKGEKLVLENYNRSFVIRTSWIFGRGRNFANNVIKWSEHNRKLRIVDDQVSCPTFAKDLAFYSWKLIKTEKFGLYHLTNNGECSKYKQAKFILDKIRWNGDLIPVKTKEFNLRAERPKYSKLNCEKLEKIIEEKIPNWQSGYDRYFSDFFYIDKKKT